MFIHYNLALFYPILPNFWNRALSHAMYTCEISLKNVSSFSNMNTSLSFLYSVDYETLIPLAFDLSVTDHPIQPLVVLDEFKRKRKLINVNIYFYCPSLVCCIFQFFLTFLFVKKLRFCIYVSLTIYSSEHGFFLTLVGWGQRTALIASSNTVFRPRWVKAEHSRYFTASIHPRQETHNTLIILIHPGHSYL